MIAENFLFFSQCKQIRRPDKNAERILLELQIFCVRALFLLIGLSVKNQDDHDDPIDYAYQCDSGKIPSKVQMETSSAIK